jgi:hypothetical protein
LQIAQRSGDALLHRFQRGAVMGEIVDVCGQPLFFRRNLGTAASRVVGSHLQRLLNRGQLLLQRPFPLAGVLAVLVERRAHLPPLLFQPAGQVLGPGGASGSGITLRHRGAFGKGAGGRAYGCKRGAAADRPAPNPRPDRAERHPGFYRSLVGGGQKR